MSTQGLLSVIEEGTSDVMFKVIAGSDGYNIEELKRVIIENKWVFYSGGDSKVIAEILYEFAGDVDFGCKEDLVVSFKMDNNEIYHIYKGDDELTKEYNSLYWDEFNNVTFNPRWQYGTAAYTDSIIIPTIGILNKN